METTATDYIWILKRDNKNLRRQLECYKNDSYILKMRQEYESLLREKDREIAELRQELAESRAETVKVRNLWMQVTEDVEAEKEQELKKAESERIKTENRVAKAEEKISKLKDTLKTVRKEKYDLGEKLEEAEDQNKKLTAQVNKDFENSSIPSSKTVKRKKIPCSREQSGKKPGGQPEHEGATRKKQEVTTKVVLDPPDSIKNDPTWYPTEKVIRKQKVSIRITIETTEYESRVYRNRETKCRYHAPFPEGIVNDVNYDGTVKAAAFLLNTECDVSVEKTKQFLFDLSDGKLDISTGMINGLCQELSEKTTQERSEIVASLMTSPVMNADFTNANVNGKDAQVLVLASESKDVALYIAREHKGHKGVEGTPLEKYNGTAVHDHDVTFYKYAERHQECLQHNLRYLKGSIENEPWLNWNKQMHKLHQEMIHYRNGLGENDPLDPAIVADYEKRYDEIIKLGIEEYREKPPSKYYNDGYNLLLRLRDYKESELLFLHDKRVPHNNNICLCELLFYANFFNSSPVYRMYSDRKFA